MRHREATGLSLAVCAMPVSQRHSTMKAVTGRPSGCRAATGSAKSQGIDPANALLKKPILPFVCRQTHKDRAILEILYWT